LLDDREERAGVKFKDADLVGIPVQVVIGKGLAEGQIEVGLRTEKEGRQTVPQTNGVEYIANLVAEKRAELHAAANTVNNRKVRAARFFGRRP
jgi:prolyl-tRNA synthetase